MHENQTIIGLTPKLVEIFASVLDEPAEQLDLPTRAKLIGVVKFIHDKNASLVSGSPVLMSCIKTAS